MRNAFLTQNKVCIFGSRFLELRTSEIESVTFTRKNKEREKGA